MSEKSVVIDGLIRFIKENAGTKNGLICTVTSIDTTKKTCYCEPIGDYADIQQVKLIARGDKSGFYMIPKLNSEVLVSFLDDESAYVAQIAELDKLYITIDGSNNLVYDSTAWIWNGGSLGGMAKTGAIKTKLNNIETDLNNLKAVIALIAAAGSGSPSTPVTNATLAAFFSSGGYFPTPLFVLTTQAEIEDTKIKH